MDRPPVAVGRFKSEPVKERVRERLPRAERIQGSPIQ
jgi:hypothetical protein